MTTRIMGGAPFVRSSLWHSYTRSRPTICTKRSFVQTLESQIGRRSSYVLPSCSGVNERFALARSSWKMSSAYTTDKPFFSQLHALSTLSDDKDFKNADSSNRASPASNDSSCGIPKIDFKMHRKQQEARKRAVLALCAALARDLQTSAQSTRAFSTSGGDGFSGKDEKDSKSGSKPPAGETDGPSVGTTEKDFSDYLTGKTNLEGVVPPVVQPPFSTTSASDWIIDLSAEQIKKSTMQDNYSEQYRHIQRKQETSREIARAKTAANVRRALVGNVIICASKLGAWISSGSSAMLSEFVHSVVDCGNQGLLLLGLRDSRNVADKSHPYGYGKSIYFWALVSALGTFFLGAGLSMTHAVGELVHPSVSNITWEVWTVLALSFAVDGYVLGKTVADIKETMPTGTSFYAHVQKLRDPATLAVLLEDGAACLGIMIAVGGIGATQMTGLPVFDGIAGVSISCLLGAMGLALVKINHRFLLGQAVDHDTTEGIKQILLKRRSIDNVYSVQSQWTGPETFSYKAEVDFDGTFLAAKLMPRYQAEFLEVKDTLDQDLRVLLSWYAEDVMRTVEREVRHIEAEIRKEYPGAEFIELEPMSKDSDRFAVDDGWQAQLRRIELERLNRYLKTLYPVKGNKQKEKNAGKVKTTVAADVEDFIPDEKWKPKQ